VSDVQSENL